MAEEFKLQGSPGKESDFSSKDIQRDVQRDIQRLTAHKVWISDIMNAPFQKQEGETDFVELNGKKVSRVNLVASVVDKYTAETFATLTLDDGSAQFRLKAFSDTMGKLQNVETGDIILAIGRVKSYNNETYAMPEIVKKVSPRYALLRKLELEQEYGKRNFMQPQQAAGQQPQQQFAHAGTEKRAIQSKLDAEGENENGNGVVEIRQSESGVEMKNEKELSKDKIKLMLEKLDNGEGVESSILRGALEAPEREKFDDLLEELLGEGEAYEPRPGKVKLI